jgi:excisionase family DNA binding protein
MGEPRSINDDVLTLAEVAAYLRVCRSTIYRLLKAGKIPAFKIGSDWRFNREHIDEWRLKQEPGRIGESERTRKKEKG